MISPKLIRPSSVLTLAQAVAGGLLTSGQKNAILAERRKLEAKLTVAKYTTDAQRHLIMQQVRQELKDWAATTQLHVSWLFGPRTLYCG